MLKRYIVKTGVNCTNSSVLDSILIRCPGYRGHSISGRNGSTRINIILDERLRIGAESYLVSELEKKFGNKEKMVFLEADI